MAGKAAAPVRTNYLGVVVRAIKLCLRVAPAIVLLAAVGAPTSAGAATRYAVTKRLCSVPQSPHTAMCFVQERRFVRAGTKGARQVKLAGGATRAGTIGPAGGLTPSDLAAAYGLNTTGGAGQTVAIVDAYNDPNIDADLQTFDAQYGLAPCSVANGCLQIVNQNGSASPLPPNDISGWSIEESLDVQAVHSVCQGCKIILVEANTSNDSDLAVAENTAAALHATEINNSFGEPEPQASPSFAAAFNHPGTVVTAATGDDGYYSFDLLQGVNTPNVPSSTNTVVSVGGTSLYLTQNGTRSYETVWNTNGPKDVYERAFGQPLGAAGGGCSAAFPAQKWQSALSVWGETGCGGNRLAADISALADPLTGFDIFDSYNPGGGAPGWATFGGTSLSSPIVAAAYGLAGGAQGVSYPALTLYGHLASAYDVTVGGNGWCAGMGASQCGNPNSPSAIVDCAYAADGSLAPGNRACSALAGYDGPTGVGTPNGVSMFQRTGPGGSVTGPAAVAANQSGVWHTSALDPFPGGAISSYSWDWGDGTPNTITPNVTAAHTYRAGGTRTIRVTMTDTYAMTGVATYTVRVASPTRPTNVTKPRIGGSARVGARLVASTGTWSGVPAPAFSFQWQRCRSTCANIARATGSSYTPARADRGAKLRVVVTARNVAGSSSAASGQVGPVR